MKITIVFLYGLISVACKSIENWHDTVKLHQQNDHGDLYEVNMNDHRLNKGEHVGQGDMLFKEGEEEAWFEGKGNTKRDAVRDPRAKWPGATVPYIISAANSAARTAISQAIAEYKAKTCIKFVERTNQKDYIRIIAGGGCYSYVGRIGGRQDISLGRGCEYKSTAIHEFMHALGFFHEQSRPDRDGFVRILLQNIQQGLDSQFTKLTANSVTTFDHPYDLDSVMHYGRTAFSKNKQPTIVAKSNYNRKLGQQYLNGGLSTIDAKQLNAMYCSGGSGGGGGGGGGGTTQAPSTGLTKAICLTRMRNCANNMNECQKYFSQN